MAAVGEGLPHSAPTFRAIRDAFRRAVDAHPGALHDSSYTFGGHAVRVRILGRALAEAVARAFVHLQTSSLASHAPQLTIELCDEHEAGVPPPEDPGDDAAEKTWKTGGGTTSGYDGGRIFRYQQPGSVTWLDRGTSHIIGWRARGEDLAIHERAKPLPVLLPIWYFDRDIHVVHAGLIARNGYGVLVGGASGTGKTTTTLACLSAGGLDYLGDDQIGLAVSKGGSFLGYSLYNCTRLAPRHLARFPRLVPYAIPGDDSKDDKLLILLSEVLPARVQRLAQVRAVALPRIVTAGEPRVCRASKAEALLRLAPTSVFTPFGPGAAGFQRLAKLVQTVPAFWLELGHDPQQIARHVEQLLAEALRS